MHELTPEDVAYFDEHGYVIVKDAVPQNHIDATIAAIQDFVGGPERERWYDKPYTEGGMLAMYHHPAMWANRQHPRVYGAFADILGNDELWVTFDRVCAKLPMHPDHPSWSSYDFMHWDNPLKSLPLERRVQGVLCLTPGGPGRGGFQCIPGIHKTERLQAIKASQPDDWQPMRGDESGLIKGKGVELETDPGDLVIWHIGTAHGNAPNPSSDVRYCQYILCTAANNADDEKRQQRIHNFTNRTSGGFPEDPRHWEQEQALETKLTPLGRKLVGLDTW